MILIHYAVNAAVLAYGGIRDHHSRMIPDSVPLILLLTGLVFGKTLLLSTGMLILTAAVFLLLDKLTDGGSPGGDFKLLCALAFSSSVPVFLGTLLVSSLGALLVCKLKKTGLKEHIPWCAFVAPGYILSSPAIYLILCSTGGFTK